ncbi:hypothetical protein VP01_2872g4 [Puccinia sorghi]|uniref:Uncharacterized protein n=1 Tax=Puccinia sorghi TaxID=27349 RepID=A0A0L6V1V1_9BASI|nr:hypothetical protein VP01_2872g4 [Puccinia sorghi]
MPRPPAKNCLAVRRYSTQPPRKSKPLRTHRQERRQYKKAAPNGKKSTPNGKKLTATGKAPISPSNNRTPAKQRACSANPMSSKKSPLQMTKQDHPQGFEHTKPNQIPSPQEAFYIHIKVLWGLVAKKAIPVAPPNNFNPLINMPPESRQAYAPSQANSLYNVAHKMLAIKTFRKCVASNAYTFMNVNATYTNNFELLKNTYNHYVQCLLLNIYSKEKKRKSPKKSNSFSVITMISSLKREVYIVKKLQFCSNSANKFFLKTLLETIFPKAPKGLLLDFYDLDWFNNKPLCNTKIWPTLIRWRLSKTLANPSSSLTPTRSYPTSDLWKNAGTRQPKNKILTLWINKRRILLLKMTTTANMEEYQFKQHQRQR